MDLLKRERQLSDLGAHLRQAAAGDGRVVMVGGEAGVGKTALVSHFARYECDAAQVLQASCDALSTPCPLGPMCDLAPALGIDKSAFSTDLDGRDALFRSLLDVLVSRRSPTVIIAEDAHWADDATLELVRFLARRIAGLRALVVVTYRDDELGPHHGLRRTLGDLAAAPTVFRMDLPPLSLAAVRRLTAGQPRDPELLHRLTGGNPFFLTEILASHGESIPATVGDAVLARAARLAPAARAVLDIAAVIGSHASQDLLTIVAGPVYDEIDACVDCGLLRFAEQLAFRHELVREAIMAAMSPPRRRLLHGRVLAALCEHPALEPDQALLAHHAEGAADAAAVRTFALAAAEQARTLHSHREAAAQYARVLRFGAGMPDRDRATILDARSMACYLSDRLDDAIAARLEALAIWGRLQDPIKEGDARRWLSRLYWFNGRGAEAMAAGEAALKVLEALPPGPELAMAYSNLSQLRMLANDGPGAIAWGERAIALSDRLGDAETVIHALINVGTARRLVEYDNEQGVCELERALDLAQSAGFVDHAGRALTNLACTYFEAMQLAESERRLAIAIAYSVEHDLENYRLYQLGTRAMVRCQRGAWDDALADSWEVLRRPELSPVTRFEALTAYGQILARRGQPGAQAALDEALAFARSTGELQRLAPVAVARAESALLAGDARRALTEALAVAELVDERGSPWLRGAIASALWQAGHRHRLAGTLAEPYVHQLAGNWPAAAAAWRAAGCPYEEALALMASGNVAQVRQSLTILERLQAKPAIGLARRRLRALGVHDLPALRRGPHRATRDHPAGLTQREAQVLDLIVAGLNRAEIADRLFLTPKTVSHHVSAVYAKLDASNRAEALSAAAKIGVSAA